MPLLLDKILGLLAMPLGIAIGTGALALVALVSGWPRRALGLLVFSILWLWGWSTFGASNAVLGSLMDRYPIRPAEAFPTADAIVVLGGGVSPISHDRIHPNLTRDADRVWHAARLHRAGKAALIIASGGDVWNLSRQSEADAMRDLLTALGVPDEAVVTEGGSRTTRQNALLSAGVAADRGIERVLLVTSAWHMPRAAAAFRRAGLDVIPAPTDDERVRDLPWVLKILPDTDALALSTLAYREYIGLLIYRLRGWI